MYLVNLFFCFYILRSSWWEQVEQGVGYGKVFHCYIEKEQFCKNGYDDIHENLHFWNLQEKQD